MENNLQILGDFLEIIISSGYSYLFASVTVLSIFISAILFYKFNPAYWRPESSDGPGSGAEAYAELNPFPLIRTDAYGKILFRNQKAEDLKNFGITERNVSMLFPRLKPETLQNLILHNHSHSFKGKIKNRRYQINVTGISALNTAQFSFIDISGAEDWEKKLKYSEKKQRELSHNLLTSIEEERRRIAGELHDSIGQNLLTLKLRLQKKAGSSKSDIHIHEMIKITETVINELKEVIFNLCPKILEEAGLKPALVQLKNRISETFGICGELNVELQNSRFNKYIEITVYRIVQESLNNIIKHSGASEFGINLFFRGNNLIVIVSDNGRGFNPEEYSLGFGLFNMKTRVEQYLGTMDIESVKNEGTTLIFNIPVNEEKNKNLIGRRSRVIPQRNN